MQKIFISVAQRIATAAQGTCAVQDNADYLVEFSFDPEWENFAVKSAVFVWQEGEGTVAEFVSFSGNVAPMPKISGSSYVLIGVTAGEGVSSTAVKIPCIPSVITHAGRGE